MSGSIGGDRIPHSAVQGTVDKFVEILKSYKAFNSLKPSGSTADSSKKDHGDIDVVVYLEGSTTKEAKRDFMAYLDSLPDTVTVPFRTGRNKGKKSMMYADIVTCQIPMEGFEGLLVQIDSAITLSEQEQEYKKSFLDLSGEKQALLMGLVRTVLIEENPEKVFKRLGIKKLPELNNNQEFEFVLSPNGLTLRQVTLDDQFKEASREDIWKSQNWSDVEKLLTGFDLSKDFDELLSDVKAKNLSTRSKVRIKGIFNSVLVVGPGEMGKPKGDNKERAKARVSDVLSEIEEVEETSTVALYGGGFKPPHKAHFANVEKLCEKADRVIIFIGPKVREGVPITAQQSEQIWNIYKKYLHKPVEIRIAEKTPITSIYELIANPELSNIKFIVGKSQEADDAKKYVYLEKNKSNYPNVVLKTLPVVVDKADQKFSASTLRKSIEAIKKGDWIPSCLDRDDARKVLDILTKPLERQALQEEMKAKMKNVLNGVAGLKENSSGISVRPNSIISSEKKSELAALYNSLEDQWGQNFNVQFNQSSIVITPRYEEKYMDYAYLGDTDIDESKNTSDNGSVIDSKWWAKNAASMLGFFQKEGLQLEPLPEIILKKEPQSNGLLDKTGDYDPNNNIIHVYTSGRHPRDVYRSLAHEIYHAHQNHVGKIGQVSTEQISQDKQLEELEGEAYREGNLLFRRWLESLGDYQHK